METLFLLMLVGSLVVILALLLICSILNKENLELKCENQILNRELKQYNLAAHKLLDKLENK
ncbi:putative membrane protein [Escherichia phage vB_EcoS_ESCO30]|uniref:Membrane protein n=1 Tax=Escherichia phage vB_EcoS_ESCO30 TaxID=2918879 RepID=A0AAE9HIU6_9CAUD|nr:putative membrane protein [Escherichia phage vB_EcoS_ESCO30]